MRVLDALACWALLAPSVAGNYCRSRGRDCEWFGTSPSCSWGGTNIGEWDAEGRQLVATTVYYNWNSLCDAGGRKRIGDDCCDRYGATCWSGYKRLWCYPADYTQDANCDSVEYHFKTKKDDKADPQYYCERICHSGSEKRTFQVDFNTCRQQGAARPTFDALIDWGKTKTTWEVYGKGVYETPDGGEILAHGQDESGKAMMRPSGGIPQALNSFKFEVNVTFAAEAKPSAGAGIIFGAHEVPDAPANSYAGLKNRVKKAGLMAGVRKDGTTYLGPAIQVSENDTEVEAVEPPKKNWFLLKVFADVNSIVKVYVDDVHIPKIDLKDTKYLNGRIGLKATGGARVTFSDMKLSHW